MRAACQLAAQALRLAGSLVQPGVTTDHLDHAVHEFIISAGAYPSPLNYQGFPKSICTSVNEVVCHGIPDSRCALQYSALKQPLFIEFGPATQVPTVGCLLVCSTAVTSDRIGSNI